MIDSNSLSVLLVDDHPLVASGIAELLRHQNYSVALARSLAEARSALQGSPDVLLLDINLGGENGLTLLEEGLVGKATRTILLSGVSDQEWIFRGFELGAFGFIAKSVEPTELLAALDQILGCPILKDAGWIWDTQTKRAISALDFFPRETILTPKERDVFMLLRNGLLDKQIADQLGLSIHTVRVHIRAIKRKRGHNRRFEQHF